MTQALDKSLWPPTYHERWMSADHVPGLVSVIIPTYNRAHLITETLDSVFDQTYRPIELIVVDDGSTDDTRQVIERWRQGHMEDSGFELCYFCQENRGPSAARNLGLIQSQGEYIQFLDSDDRLSPLKIAAQMEAASDHPDCVMHGPWRLFSAQDEGVLVGELNSPEGGNYPFAQGDYIRAWCAGFEPPHCFLWPRQWVHDIGPWDESLIAFDDLDFLGRGFLAGIQLAYVRQGVAYYRLHDGSGRLSGSVSELKLESMLRTARRMEKGLRALGIWKEYHDALALMYYGIARKSAVFYPAYYRVALDQYKLLRDPGARRPGTLRHRIMAGILGVRGAETLSYLIRKVGISVHTIPMTTCGDYGEMENMDRTSVVHKERQKL